jgi:hypothetical protein
MKRSNILGFNVILMLMRPMPPGRGPTAQEGVEFGGLVWNHSANWCGLTGLETTFKQMSRVE